MQHGTNNGCRARSPKRKASPSNSNGYSTFSSSAPVTDNQPFDLSTMKAHLCQQLSDFLQINELESDVKPYKEAPSRQIRSYRVKRVVSPFEIYLELVLDHSVKDYYNWFSNMQKHYNSKDTREKWHLRYKTAVLGRCYVYNDPDDNLWHRVRVHGANNENDVAKIFYCDLGKRKQVKYNSLLELDPLYAAWSSQLFRAYLYDVMPITNDFKWSPEAIQFFKDTVEKKELSGLTMVRSDSVVTLGLPETIMNIGIVLYDHNLNPTSGIDVCTLNSLMVDKKFAYSIGAFSSCNHQLMGEQFEPYFNLEAFTSEYPLQCEKDGPATSPRNGDVALTKRKLKELLNIEMNPKPVHPSVLTDKDLLELDEFAIYDTNKDDFLPDEVMCRLGHIKLCSVTGPAHLVGHYQTRMEAMKNMQIALKVTVGKEEAIQKEDTMPGMFIACEIIDPVANKENIWCRAVIKVKISEGSFKVILVDYGSELSVKQEVCRRLPKYFEKFPSFAVRMHMDVENVKPTGQSGWSNDACFSFRRYVFEWQHASPSYFGYRNNRSETLCFSDFGQGVNFDSDKKKWVTSPARKIDVHQPINELKDHPLLRSLYRSVGVALFYETVVDGSCFWFVEPLYDQLVQNGFAISDVRTKSKHVIHDEIVKTVYFPQGDKRAERKHLPFSLDTNGRKKGDSHSPRVGIFQHKMFVLQDGKAEYVLE